MEFVSETYRVKPSACVRLIMQRWAARWSWIGVGSLMILVTLSFAVDSAFAFVAAMTLFVVFPFILSMAYFNYGLKPDVAIYALPQRLTIDDDGLTVEFLRERGNDDGSFEVKSLKRLKFGDVMAVVSSGSNLALLTGKAPDTFLIIPNEAFKTENGDIRVKFEELIYETIQRK